jgi:hypothetical protein
MASRKQRRKREKLQRHEYEYVLEGEDGEEQSAARLSELEAEQAKDAPRVPKGEIVDRRGRVVPKPSLERILRRGMIFAPFVFLFVYLTGRNDLSTIGIVMNTVVILAFLLPFMFLVDSLVYRMALKRYGPGKR